MKKPSPEEAEAPTTVLWDINRCPVPSGFDPRFVGPCIKRLLKYSCYIGTVTITAVGILTNVPNDVLRAVSSTGIGLHHFPNDDGAISTQMMDWAEKNPPPTNIMVITHGRCLFRSLWDIFHEYNILRLFSYSQTYSEVGLEMWKEFLQVEALEKEQEDEEDECCETVEWVCFVCQDNAGYGFLGEGFKSFTRHLSSKKHARKWSEWFPLASHSEKDATTKKRKQPEAKNAFTKKRKQPEAKNATTKKRKQPEAKDATTRGK